MKTVKMSAKEIKGLGTFTAVTKTGKVIDFKVDGDSAINIETGKATKIDTIRRSYEIVVDQYADAPKAQWEIEERGIETMDELNEALAEAGMFDEIEEEVATTEEVQTEEVESVEEVKEVQIGDYVLTPFNTVGYVVDIFKTLATVETTVLDANNNTVLSEEGLQVDTLTTITEGYENEIKELDALRTFPVSVVNEVEKEKTPVTGSTTSIPMVAIVDHEFTTTPKNTKLVVTVELTGDDQMIITDYSGYIMDVRVVEHDVDDEGNVSTEVMYKSPKQSVKDTLINYYNFTEEQVKALSKEISKQRKAIAKEYK